MFHHAAENGTPDLVTAYHKCCVALQFLNLAFIEETNAFEKFSGNHQSAPYGVCFVALTQTVFDVALEVAPVVPDAQRHVRRLVAVDVCLVPQSVDGGVQRISLKQTTIVAGERVRENVSLFIVHAL